MQLERLIEEIGKVNILQVDYILDAAMNRKRELFPDWELFYCAAEKGKISCPEDMLKAAWEFETRIRNRYGR